MPNYILKLLLLGSKRGLLGELKLSLYESELMPFTAQRSYYYQLAKLLK